jgi:formamidopyrimidine-DNA glycosylase
VPELPEVETVRRGLDRILPGKVAVSVKVTGARSVRRQRPAELRDRLEGRRFVRTDRRGKYLALLLDDGQVLVVHLRMSGQLLWVGEPASVPKAAHTHVVMGLDDGSELRFVDPRTFGEWFVTEDVRRDGLPVEFDRLGPDPLVDRVTAKLLRARLGHKKTAVKVALTDQAVIAGIGNLYADEICHAARVRPDRRCDALSEEELRALSRSIASILGAAVKRRGSSLRDASYRDLMGELGDYQRNHRVYDRSGEPCRRCGSSIEKIGIGARVAYCCPGCQV